MITYKQELMNEVLYHDGRRGMHWGVRKYRNYDGTLTEAGRARYGVGPAREGSSGGEKKLSRREKKALKEVKRKASAKAAEKKAKLAEENAKKALEEAKKERQLLEAARKKNPAPATAEENAQKKLDTERHRYDNDELKMQIEQMKLERELKQLLHPAKKSLLDKAIDFADKTKKLSTYAKDVNELVKTLKGNSKEKSLKERAEEDKLKYEMDFRKRQREGWAEADAKKAAGSTSEPAKPKTEPAKPKSEPSTPRPEPAAETRSKPSASDEAWARKEAAARREAYEAWMDSRPETSRSVGSDFASRWAATPVSKTTDYWTPERIARRERMLRDEEEARKYGRGL